MVAGCNIRPGPPPLEEMPDQNFSATEIDSIMQNYAFKYDDPIVLDSINLLIPITFDQPKRGNKLDFGSEYSSYTKNHNWNVMFYNALTKEVTTLVNQKSIIEEIDPKNHSNYSKELRTKIFYSIKQKDHNNDQLLDKKDPTRLFVSNFNGQDLKPISPQREHLLDYAIMDNQPHLIIKTRRDVNQDLTFSTEDPVIWYSAILEDDSWVVVEIAGPTHHDNLEKLFFQHWVKESKHKQ